jgi:predicted patatin/cPLA2 family phospholipase
MRESVIDVLRRRRGERSVPGHRSDACRVALVIEGGSSRGAYSAGMTVAVERLGLLPAFDAVYGSSAGSLNAAWLLCGRAESTMHAWWTPQIMRGTINPRRALVGKPVVDTRYLVHTVYTEVMPMGFQEILDNPVEFHPLATDAHSGASTDLHPYVRSIETLQSALRASAAMPLLSGEPVELAGRRFVDAGVSESVPVRSALADGATHIVAFCTRREDEVATPPSRGEQLLVGRWFARHATGAAKAWLGRHLAREEEASILATHSDVIAVRPPLGSRDVRRTERRPEALRHAVELGCRVASDALQRTGPDVDIVI